MALVDIIDGAAVRNHIAVETPLASQDVDEQMRVSATGLAVCSVVRAHDGRGLSFHDRCPKRRQISFPQIAFIDFGIEAMALGLGSGVHGIVLRGGHNFQVFGIVPLQSFNESDTQAACQVWILSVSFLSAAPARVAKDVYVWRPE